MRRRRGLALVGLGLVLVLAVSAGVRVAPTAIGGGTTYAVVADGSMEPALHPGDLVIVRARDDYLLGDVVAVRAARGLVPRRVIGVSAGLLRLKSDAGAVTDREGVSSGAVVGRVVATVPGAGRGLDWLRDPRRLTWLALSFGLCSLAVLAGAWLTAGRVPRRVAARAPERSPAVPVLEAPLPASTAGSTSRAQGVGEPVGAGGVANRFTAVAPTAPTPSPAARSGARPAVALPPGLLPGGAP